MKINTRYYRRKYEDPYSRIHFLIKNHKWEWQSVGTIAALGGGLFSPLIGLLLDSIVWFNRAGHLRLLLPKMSITFYILTFPLLALGAHCLDLLEKISSGSPSDDLQPHKFDLGLKA